MTLSKIYIIAGGGGAAAVAIIVFFTFLPGGLGGQEYAIFVDPIIDKQSLFVMSRVMIQNTGTKPLTNVRANFGSADIQEFGTLQPGQKILVSPRAENTNTFVIVTADEGIYVSKAYREPIKMPGMMGS